MFLTICRLKHDIDDFTTIQHRKNQTAIGKHSHRILVTIPYFTGNYHS